MTYPSVTQVLQPYSGLENVNPTVLKHAAARGTQVHAACAKMAEGSFYQHRLTDSTKKYVKSFGKWCDTYVDRVLSIEEEWCDHAYRFVGHQDYVVQLNKMFSKQFALIDIKTPRAESVTWKAQLAAYKHLVEQKYIIDIVMALLLSPDGKRAKAIVYQHHSVDFAAFLCALQAWWYFKGAK